uniref:Endo/exonuclease/phosphatase domain-containing protein n=1 Tax=Rhabditophanes sp. KR3021 TaxID=114890 RepID=A0AC35U097_9BILA
MAQAITNQPTQKTADEEDLNVFNFVSWNINGIATEQIRYRMYAAILQIQPINPDVIFFQEVIAQQARHIKNHYESSYNIYYQDEHLLEYSTVILVSKKHRVLEALVKPFPRSIMDSALQIVLMEVGHIKLALINTNLESFKEHTKERVKQLVEAFNVSHNFEKSGYHVIFGGDLNIRNKEAMQNVDESKDCFMMAGCPKPFTNTWIMERSAGQTFEQRLQQNHIRARFDRIYSFGTSLKFKSFQLFGLNKLLLDVDISDHLGIHIAFTHHQNSTKQLERSGENDGTSLHGVM